MRSSVFVALIIIICLFAFACFGYYYYQRERVLSEYTVAPETLEPVTSSIPTTSAIVSSTTQSNESFTETSEVVEVEPKAVTDESQIDEDINEILDELETIEVEECCEDDVLLTEEPTLRDKLIEQHGDTPDIDLYFRLSDKSHAHLPLSLDETVEWFRLLDKFFPSPENRQTYEQAKKFYKLYQEEGVKGSYSMTYGDGE